MNQRKSLFNSKVAIVLTMCLGCILNASQCVIGEKDPDDNGEDSETGDANSGKGGNGNDNSGKGGNGNGNSGKGGNGNGNSGKGGNGSDNSGGGDNGANGGTGGQGNPFDDCAVIMSFESTNSAYYSKNGYNFGMFFAYADHYIFGTSTAYMRLYWFYELDEWAGEIFLDGYSNNRPPDLYAVEGDIHPTSPDGSTIHVFFEDALFAELDDNDHIVPNGRCIRVDNSAVLSVY